ncbi:MAG: transporter [Gemmatimonadetes bacterium]|nr:transporter [Gemmatimonadota bacterium]
MLAVLGTIAAAAAGLIQDAPPIADNSFLLEEAYNQEPGVVQHISALQRTWGSAAWSYSFVQEWPLGGQHDQLSFTFLLKHAEATAGATGLGDLALNYRRQLTGTDARVSFAPRLSLLFPTGDEAKGFGSGGLGIQVNLPVSATLARALVTHWNAGATLTPSARDPNGSRAMTTGVNLGASVIWLLHPNLNVVVETVWNRDESVIAAGRTAARSSWFVNPGIRWAHNFRNGLQVVPGVAFPLGLGPSSGERSLFLYLSFEHPF